jgi:hypothetical protein
LNGLMRPIRLTLLGRFSLTHDTGRIERAISKRQQALLAFVALNEETIDRSRLAGTLWADKDEQQARQSLRQLLLARRGPFLATSGLMHRGKQHLYSIASSVIASKLGGMVRPRAFAVFRLITNSNLVGSVTGRSVGFSPLRIRPA